MEITPGKWELIKEDLTIRSQAFGKSDQMGDYRGIIIADLKPAVGCDTDEHGDVKYETMGRRHALPETLANAERIVKAVNSYDAIYEALKDIQKYVLGLDACGPETTQVIAGKCYIALAEGK